MGFPSPAADYVERTLTPESLCGITANSLVIETSDGWAVVERGMRPQKGSTLLISYSGGRHFAKWCGRSLITYDGEALEGGVLDEVEVIGVVTHMVIDLLRDDCPVI